MSFSAPESLSEQIARYLAQRIIQGQLKSGERIQETRVVSELEVSRGSVREALLILESRHLIDILPRRGAVVAMLTEEGVRSLYDLYIHLLTMLAQNVAKHWNDHNIQPLLAQVHAIQALQQSDDKMAFVESGFVLMRMAFAVAGNQYLADILEDLQPVLHRTYSLAIRRSPHETEYAARFFAGLMDAVLSRNQDALPGLLQDYGRHQRELVLAAMAEEACPCV
ncbi:MAG: GntR family transcriptional regulator [Saccharospirillaceae bacterium]|nr:GntR family transcriptional regulator [Saccharospirillaceae bacterium]